MNILAEYGRDDLAKVYVAQLRNTKEHNTQSAPHLIEFVESIQPPLPREEKWVLIVSSMFGCPIQCKMCDAGGDFSGCLTVEEILAQITYMVHRRYPDGTPTTSKFKIQFARMGEPTLNPAVLTALEKLPRLYEKSTLHVSLSSVAPKTKATKKFFEKLLLIKKRWYSQGRFQLQFSIHTTDTMKRDELIPIKKWSFEDIAAYGERFRRSSEDDKKITLNFAPIVGYPLNVEHLRSFFDPQHFLIKITPINPTVRSQEASLLSAVNAANPTTSYDLIKQLRKNGYDVILSIGVLEENQIGSNCGQYIQRALGTYQRPADSYELERYCLE